MKAAMIFPGQGSQFTGMGRDLIDNFPYVADIYKEADDTLRFPISRLCFRGDPEVLKETRNAQPAILLHSIAVMRILRREGGIEPVIVAGHSLGEYSALVAAGVLNEMDALRIVRRRGELMFEAGLEQPGAMAAVIGIGRDAVESACEEASGGGKTVVIANINAPGQTVISGHNEAVEEAMKLAGKRGAKKVVRLNVSGAFHSPLVAHAQEELCEYLESHNFNDAAVRVICNVDAKVVVKREEIIDALSRQLTGPVLWSDSMKVLLKAWDGQIIEVGPGKVLAGLMKRIDRSRSVWVSGTVEDLEKFIAPIVEIT